MLHFKWHCSLCCSIKWGLDPILHIVIDKGQNWVRSGLERSGTTSKLVHRVLWLMMIPWRVHWVQKALNEYFLQPGLTVECLCEFQQWFIRLLLVVGSIDYCIDNIIFSAKCIWQISDDVAVKMRIVLKRIVQWISEASVIPGYRPTNCTYEKFEYHFVSSNTPLLLWIVSDVRIKLMARIYLAP